MDGEPEPFSMGSLASAVTLGLAYGIAWGFKAIYDAYTKRQEQKEARDAEEEEERQKGKGKKEEEVTRRITRRRRKH